MWICPVCGKEIDRIDHIVFIGDGACCREAVEEARDEDEFWADRNEGNDGEGYSS